MKESKAKVKQQAQVLVLVEEKCLPDSMTRTDKDLEFRNELQHLLNRYGMDNLCNMRDFVLAEYINKTLYNLAQASAIEDFMRNG